MIYSENKDESLDKCRRMQTSRRRIYTSVYECRQVTRRVQMNVDESLDRCRQIQTSHQTSVGKSLNECRQTQTRVEESKFSSLIPEKVTHGPILLLLLLQLCNGRPHRFGNFQFCSFMCDYCSTQFLGRHISKTHLPIVSFNLCELELMFKRLFKEKGRQPCVWGWKPNSPTKS